jgi:uncharacterized NAD-dependent epimerase/dehydratase family protein
MGGVPKPCMIKIVEAACPDFLLGGHAPSRTARQNSDAWPKPRIFGFNSRV